MFCERFTVERTIGLGVVDSALISPGGGGLLAVPFCAGTEAKVQWVANLPRDLAVIASN